MDSFHKFEDTGLPEKEHFFSMLTGTSISDEEYHQAKLVYKEFGYLSLGQYHDLYLTSDVLLLCDVFEAFRNMCMTNYSLDPAHFFTSPGLTWQTALKMTRIKLDFLTDIDIHLFIEEGIRVGVATISHRYFKANLPEFPETYDPSKENEYIIYLDANNLYGWAMSQYLPTGNFKWLHNEDFDVFSIEDDSPKGYILEVDLGNEI